MKPKKEKVLSLYKPQTIRLTAAGALETIAARLIWDGSHQAVAERAVKIAEALGWRV